MTRNVLAARPKAPAEPLAATLWTFAQEHGGATAVVEYLRGQKARIVLVGDDGEWSEVPADGTDVARKACEAAGITVENSWAQALEAALYPDAEQ